MQRSPVRTRSQTRSERKEPIVSENEYPTPYEAAQMQELNKAARMQEFKKPSPARKRNERRNKAVRAEKIYVPKPNPQETKKFVEETLDANTIQKLTSPFIAEVNEEKVIQNASDEANLVKAVVSGELAAVAAELASITLPTYQMLCEICEAAKNRDLGKHGKEDISQLHEGRRTKLLLIDIIRFHLDNGTFKLKAKNEVDIEMEKRDILAGGMDFIKELIKDDYTFFSPDRSTVHKKYKDALKAFSDESIKRARIAFAGFFIENDLANYKAKDKTVEFFTSKMISEAISEYVMTESMLPPKSDVRGGFTLYGFYRPTPNVQEPKKEATVAPAPTRPTTASP